MSRSLIARLYRKYSPESIKSRREMLRQSALLGASLMISTPVRAMSQSGKRVVVVGAGFAGLAAAEQLKTAGYEIQVLEARNRLGGRVVSFGDFVPNCNVEGGGELIGSNHATWINYAQRFGLRLLEVTEDDLEAPIMIDGNRLSTAESNALWEELDEVLGRLNALASTVDSSKPWLSPQAQQFDSSSMASWIESQKVLSPLASRALDAQLAADNGVDTAWQSQLGMLAMVRGGGLEDFWTLSETHRCEGGNQQLALQLAQSLGDGVVRLGTPVRKIEYGKLPVRVTLASGEFLLCDDVVLTVPPSTWNQIQFEPTLPPALRPQMGSNVKFLARVRERFWLRKNLSQYSLTNGPISMTWEATDNQPDGEACLVGFSGGSASDCCRRWADEEREANYIREIEGNYPGMKQSFLFSRFMDWPSEPWTAASYSFPAPGQINLLGPMLHEGLGDALHFAGEHTCWAFVGYMEGALQSGVNIAARLRERDT